MEIGGSVLLGDVQTQRRDCPCAMSSQKQVNVTLQVWGLKNSETKGRKPLTALRFELTPAENCRQGF